MKKTFDDVCPECGVLLKPVLILADGRQMYSCPVCHLSVTREDTKRPGR